MKIALYARVSKSPEPQPKQRQEESDVDYQTRVRWLEKYRKSQNPENQVLELKRWANVAGHQVEGIYVDEVSSKDTRPQKELVLKKLRLGEIDGVAFCSLDRWGRKMSELVLELDEFSKSGKSLISLSEGLDLSTAVGRLMANVIAAMANFEMDRNHERTMAGLARARAQGKKLGRPRNDAH